MWSRGQRARRLARVARAPIVLCSGGAAVLWCSGRTVDGSVASAATSADTRLGAGRGDDNMFTAAEVATRNGVGGRRAWITVEDGVYDVTDYVAMHPGGDKILSAAGGAAEPFFALWPAHWDRSCRSTAPGSISPRVSEQVRCALRPYFVGTLRDYREDHAATVVREAYAAEPPRTELAPAAPSGTNGLDVVTYLPFQGEPRYFGGGHDFLTPNQLFYVRNHGPVPETDRATFRLTIGGSVLSVADLEQNFEQHKVTATLQCTGNRLDELSGSGQTQFAGKAGSKGFISNAEWEGPLLCEVMAAASLKFPGTTPAGNMLNQPADLDEDTGWHLEVEGADGFVVSLPWSYVSTRPVLLATRMNGEKLPPDHGAPVRFLVPGAVGARSVKWVVRADIIWGSSRSPWQRRFYRGGGTNSNSQLASESPILEWPIQGMITSVNNGDTVVLPSSARSFAVSGIAYCGGGRGIKSVVVSADGQSWHEARLVHPPGQSEGHRYAWTTWSLNLPVPVRSAVKTGTLQLHCRATDTSEAMQPSSIGDVWTPSGYLCNAEHSVKIVLAPDVACHDKPVA